MKVAGNNLSTLEQHGYLYCHHLDVQGFTDTKIGKWFILGT